jgi:hypothetical protein
MAVAIGASGIVGVAAEVTPGTYVAPAFYIPVRSESLNFINEVQFTRPIMGVADQVHAVKGPQRVEGDIEYEVLPDALVYLLKGSRTTLVKTGAGPYTYTYTPTAAATPTTTLSLTVVRNGVSFGYVGCVLGSLEFTVDNGVFVCTSSILGRSEAPQSVPTPTWPTQAPAGADSYTITVGGSPVTNADNFSWSCDESASAEYRLGVAQAAAFVKFGERNLEASLEMDFENTTEYTKFKNVTAQALVFQVDWDANHQVKMDTKLATMSTYELGLSGQGDLVRASISYGGKYDFVSSKSFELVVKSNTNIT